MNQIRTTIQRLFILSGLALLAVFPSAINAQNQPEKILIAEGAGTISGNNKAGKVIAIDVTAYESGRVLYTIKPDAGTGIGQFKGKCWGSVDFFENGKQLGKPTTLIPNQTQSGTLPFSKPTNFTIKVSPSCDASLSNNFTYQIFVTDAKLAKTAKNCSQTTNEKNPAQPLAEDSNSEGSNYKDRSFNGKAFTVVASNANANKDPILYVNGIDTTLAKAKKDAETLSKQTGTPITLIYNNSAIRGGLEQAYNSGNRNFLINPPAAQTLANLLLSRKPGDKDALVLGFSQGAAIVAEATKRMEKCRPSNGELCNVRVLTIGGAAQSNDFSKCVTLSGLAHENDLVSQSFGQNDRFNPRAFSLEQHTNYLRDPATQKLIKDWVNGDAFPFTIIPDFVQP